MGGSAILLAAESLRKAIREAAATALDCAARDIEILEGRAASAGGA